MHDDHAHATHSASCDACDYVAKTHAHDDNTAATHLSQDLAAHNTDVHKDNTDPGKIIEAVRAKMIIEDPS